MYGISISSGQNNGNIRKKMLRIKIHHVVRKQMMRPNTAVTHLWSHLSGRRTIKITYSEFETIFLAPLAHHSRRYLQADSAEYVPCAQLLVICRISGTRRDVTFATRFSQMVHYLSLGYRFPQGNCTLSSPHAFYQLATHTY